MHIIMFSEMLSCTYSLTLPAAVPVPLSVQNGGRLMAPPNVPPMPVRPWQLVG